MMENLNSWREIELSDEEKTKLFSKKKMRMYAEFIAEYLGVPMEEMMLRLYYAKEKYGIPVKYYANHQLFLDDSDEMLLANKNRIVSEHEKHVKRLMETSGMSEEEAEAFFSRMFKKHRLTAKSVLNGELYQMTDEEIAEWVFSHRDRKSKRVTRLAELSGKSEDFIKMHMAKCKAIYGIAYENYENTHCYELSDEELKTYANLEDSRRLGEKYNQGAEEILDNKILFNQTYCEFLGRKFWVNRDMSFDDFLDFINGQKEVFCKPVDLHSGIGARKLNVDINYKKVYDELRSQPKLLVEEMIYQHEEMAAFYKDSVNTIRLFTILDKDEFHAFAAFVRFGVKGCTDNVSNGGIGCGVDEKTGEIITPAMGNDGVRYECHPVTGKKFVGFRIPYWDQILEITEKALRKNESVNYVGWDIAITNKGIVIVEGNKVPDLSIYQSFFADVKDGRKYKYERFL